jgi:hypothetical protein
MNKDIKALTLLLVFALSAQAPMAAMQKTPTPAQNSRSSWFSWILGGAAVATIVGYVSYKYWFKTAKPNNSGTSTPKKAGSRSASLTEPQHDSFSAAPIPNIHNNPSPLSDSDKKSGLQVNISNVTTLSLDTSHGITITSQSKSPEIDRFEDFSESENEIVPSAPLDTVPSVLPSPDRQSSPEFTAGTFEYAVNAIRNLSSWIIKNKETINEHNVNTGRYNKALHRAAEDANDLEATQAVGILLEKKANIDLKNDSGSTALHIAAEAGNVEVVRTLVGAKADIFAKDIIERTPKQCTLPHDVPEKKNQYIQIEEILNAAEKEHPAAKKSHQKKKVVKKTPVDFYLKRALTKP